MPKRCSPNSEPECLKRGKAFHREVQRDWLETADGTILPEKTIALRSKGATRARRGRIDILVEEAGDDEMVSVVEIKATNWDRIKPRNIQRNLRSHCRQVWKYIDKYYRDGDGISVCPGIIYPDPPSSRDLRL